MKKRHFFFVGIAVLLLICIIAYFRPLSLSNAVNESNQIKMILNEFGVRNGKAYIDSVDYQTITAEQNSDIISLFDKYAYRRTFRTLLSDGSMSGVGENVLYIYVYDDVSLVGMIYVASSGEIVVNGKNYSMKDAEQFISQMLQIVN